MKYTAITPILTVAAAEQFGKWLGQYRVDVSGVAVWQIDSEGRRHRDDPLADTVTDTARTFTSAAAHSTISAPILAPIVVLLSPAALLAMAASIPLLIAAQYKLRKHTAMPDSSVGKQIVASEIDFTLTGVSAQRERWSEILLSIWGVRNKWKYKKLLYPGTWDYAMQYAATHSGYPRPWSENPRQTAPTKCRKQPGRSKQPAGSTARGMLKNIAKRLED